MNTQIKSDREEAATLEILTEISNRSDITQRHLADRLGVALGLANSYLRRCVRKGFIKIQEAPANRYLYYLTPKGFSEKSRLTAQYLAFSFDFYRQAGIDISEQLTASHLNGDKTIMFAGISELAEIARLRLEETDLVLAGTFDPQTDTSTFLGRAVYREWPTSQSVDGCLFTCLDARPELYQQLVKLIGREKIYVPKLVRALTEHSYVNES